MDATVLLTDAPTTPDNEVQAHAAYISNLILQQGARSARLDQGLAAVDARLFVQERNIVALTKEVHDIKDTVADIRVDVITLQREMVEVKDELMDLKIEFRDWKVEFRDFKAEIRSINSELMDGFENIVRTLEEFTGAKRAV